jgi:membrane protein DedA with SNARE-associated domain
MGPTRRRMTDWIKSIIQGYSYPGLIFLMFLENVFPPIPSELIMPLAGFFNTRGELSLLGIILAGCLGSVLGALPLYYAGRALGEARLRRWCDQHGHWIGVSGNDLDRSRKWFDRHGAKTVLFCRLVPGIRSMISIPAGIAEMKLWLFIVLTTIGSAVWSTFLALAGRALGARYDTVEHVIGPISTGVVVTIVVTLVVRGIAQRRQARTR